MNEIEPYLKRIATSLEDIAQELAELLELAMEVDQQNQVHVADNDMTE